MRDKVVRQTEIPLPATVGTVSAGTGTFRLPHLLSTLFGRDTDIAGLRALLEREDVRLISLTGAPGIGKSRLAIEVAHDWHQSTGNDVRFVQLASISEPSLLLPTIALGFSMVETEDDSLIDRLAAWLRSQPSILVLDNFEQIVNASSDVVDLLLHAPALTIIVTSRTALRVRGEYEWNVLPLPEPRDQDRSSPESLESNPSVAMLLDRTWSGRRGNVLTSENAPSISGICTRLNGIPLAIELAAPWLRLFSPSDLLERLDRGFAFLSGGSRDLPDRHRTLSNAIGWSDQLLDPDERNLFRQLSVFRDGWTFPAAVAICSDLPSEDVTGSMASGLSSLLDKNLVVRVDDGLENPRFSMYEMIHDYARSQLKKTDDSSTLHERHAVFYQALVHTAVPHLYQKDQAIWLERLERELGNIRSALRWMIDRGARLPALRLASGLENFWLIHDHLGEGQRWLEECLSMSGHHYPSSEARARSSLATLLMRRGEYERAERLHKRTLEFAQEEGDDELRAETLMSLGNLHFIAGDLSIAANHFHWALGIGQRMSEARIIARASNHLGEIERFTRKDADAARHYENSLALWRDVAVRERIAIVLHGLAPVVARLGDPHRAINLFKESLLISWELRHFHGAALCLSGIAGLIESMCADPVDAARLLGAANAMRESIGVRWQPVDVAEFDRSVSAVCRCLDSERYQRAFAEGADLDSNQAVDLAKLVLDSGLVAESSKASRMSAPIARGGLSRREFEIAHSVARGLTNREISECLHISEKTVEMHVSNAFRKLGFRSRLQLAAWVSSHHGAAGTAGYQVSVARHSIENTGENTGTSPIS